EVGIAALELAHRRAHGLRHIEEFEVDEYFLPARPQPLHQLEIAASHEQLEAELVEPDAVAESLDEGLGLASIGHVERHDKALARREGPRGKEVDRGHARTGDTRVLARARQASPNALNNALLSGSSVHFHSACHCTPIANARALLTLTASIVP